MATYDPTNWKTGDVITATKLNNMETGIAGASALANGALQTSGGTMTGNLIMDNSVIYGSSESIWVKSSSSLTDLTDFNDLINPRIYILPQSFATIANSPFISEGYSFFLFVNSTSTDASSAYSIQVAFDLYGRAIKTRTYTHDSGGSWSAWKVIQFAS